MMSLCDRKRGPARLRAERDRPFERGNTYGFVNFQLRWGSVPKAADVLPERCPRRPLVRLACAQPALNSRKRRQSTAQRLKKISEEIRQELKESRYDLCGNRTTPQFCSLPKA